MTRSALLVLEDGTVFHGVAIGADGCSVGEVVFNTAMTGYQEILSDPSYARQIVTLTCPHIGNVGTNSEDDESPRVFASGLVIRDLPLLASNWRSKKTLQQYLLDNKVVAIADIDTRRLTRLLRDKGVQRGCIMAGESVNVEVAKIAIESFPGLMGMDLAKVVSVTEPYEWTENIWHLQNGHTQAENLTKHVVAYDFGIKRNILRLLANRGCRITVVPATTSAESVIAMNPDGVFLSNGPGDPEPCTYAIKAIQIFLEKKIPVLGICLGHQLLALASGAKTEKMKFGHHGANHPVQEIATGRVVISSQNHGFAVNEDSLPKNLIATYRSLFDGSLQGIERTDCPAMSFQGHPEASPGPHDVQFLFDWFIEKMDQVALKKAGQLTITRVQLQNAEKNGY
ncbi:carbamoyl-phosphate synthase, small chain [Candidatus Methylobacter favarea]|uniref:Carbamoyl phosphate synthase small chain n=1 Tax=Candidatus Methylobacter favarea TaxID=2707345 RepID=A0A8S0XJR8_9GAMM|nr:glutamine-hydrolyzing carbamoyl-phosphate synthase small subunit [Candidatus Methylobacter favarea]CAA9891530.1 carbamoyl-phosphate synthase, small chain [Candidatus Methylobacter favarea]